jgi:hypothetical protein
MMLAPLDNLSVKSKRERTLELTILQKLLISAELGQTGLFRISNKDPFSKHRAVGNEMHK